MRKHIFVGVISLAAVTSSAILLGQVHPIVPPQTPETQPALVAPAAAASNPIAPALAASAPTLQPVRLPLPPADNSGVAPASLPSVKNSMEHPQTWQTAIQGVMEKIQVPQLRQQLSEGLANLAPQIARGLIDRRGDTAYATIAVYREAGEAGKQAAVALAFEGFGSRLDGTFYGRVLADMPRVPDAVDNSAPKGLMLDVSASYYLCFFLSDNGLCAGAIPHEIFKRELAAIFQQAGKAAPDVVADSDQSIQEAAVHEWLDQRERQNVVQQQQAQLAAEEAQAASASYGHVYDNSLVGGAAYPPYYYGDWGLYGCGWYNPIIIVENHGLHHDWDCHHWHDRDWRSDHPKPAEHADPDANAIHRTPTVTSGNTSSPPPPNGHAVTPSHVPMLLPPQQPVFRAPVHEPVMRPAPAHSVGAPSGPTRNGAGATASGGGNSGSHASGSSGGAAHGGGGAHR